MNYIVLGGGISSDGTLPYHVNERVKYAANAVKENDSVIFSAIFSLNIPPVLDSEGFVLSESAQMKKEFNRMCIKKDINLFLENSSFDTVGSAFFIRKIFNFVVNNKSLTLVTSDFHLDRVKNIFVKIFNLEPIINLKELKFVGLKTDVSKFSKRFLKEKSQMKNFQEEVRYITEIDQFTKWLYTSHDNYSNYFSDARFSRREGNELKY